LDTVSSQYPDILKKNIQRNEFIRLLNGMAVGEWNGRELVSGDRYFNKEFLLSIPIPEGWEVQINNNDYTAVFFDAKKESFVYFDIQALQRQKATETYFNELSDLYIKQGLKKTTTSSRVKSYSYGAITGLYQGQSRSLGDVKAQLLAFTKGSNGFSMFGIGKEESFEKLQPLFESMINGLNFISSQEASKIDPPRMRVHEVSAGETWDKIATRYFKSSNEKTKLAKYNGLEIDIDPTPGTLLKIPPSLKF
jgi:predicted Zn-dependent protease